MFIARINLLNKNLFEWFKLIRSTFSVMDKVKDEIITYLLDKTNEI